jgi:hypothetical protein
MDTQTNQEATPATTAAVAQPQDDTAQKANLRAAQLLKQTLLGKRSRESSGAAAAAAPAASSTSVAMDTSTASFSMPAASASAESSAAADAHVAAAVSAPAPTVAAPGDSPPPELPLKKRKSEDPARADEAANAEGNQVALSAPAAAAPAPAAAAAAGAAPAKEECCSSSSSSSSSAASSPVAPAEAAGIAAIDVSALATEDAFGNSIARMSFDEYFEGKWAAMQEPKDVTDEVRFGEPGWKQRYYATKLGFDLSVARANPTSEDGQTAHRLFRTYLEGLCWVMHYYLHGTASWAW